ncbi:hypothetical protein [Clostridium vincentii]|uniref:PLD phosphodiesterase domain-containing protein n=1 Tax=Clostridium vincentii TaxID=52704 RepID=A0A2T0BFV1_9CLOT|nr:hypothetical protein [Clostridium vincentii]PRR82781.1 hypothetical protein CLVI_14180 [Clostridium vincentii]
MLFTSKLNDKYEVVQSNGECCYEGILAEFRNSSNIYIMMFKDFKRNLLVSKLLNRVGPEVKVKFISDIESKYTTNPMQFKDLKDELNFDEHSKIIMTDRVVYIGTANHPSEGNKLECGFIITDSNIIQLIKEKLFKEKSKLSTLHTLEVIELEISFINYYCKVNRVLENIISGAFKEDDKGNGYYNETEARINGDDLVMLANVVVDYINKLAKIEDASLKELLNKANDMKNLESLKTLCDKDGKMKELSKLGSIGGQARSVLAEESADEILDLYERVSLFSEELYSVIEKMVEV